MSSEYPKMLFPNGDPAKPFAIADDQGQEAALRKEGYKTLKESKRHPDKVAPAKPDKVAPAKPDKVEKAED